MAENTYNNNNEGVVLAENEIVCMLTNKVVKSPTRSRPFSI